VEDSHKLFTKYVENCMFYHEKTILYTKTLEKLSVIHFAHFHTLTKHGIVFWGTSTTMHKVFLLQKGIVRIMLGIGPKSSCRNWFKKLDILMVQSSYIFSMMMFVVNNPGNFQGSSSICCMNMKYKNQLHIPLVKYSSIQSGVTPPLRYLILYLQAHFNLKRIN
jgi:hypothetical protein